MREYAEQIFADSLSKVLALGWDGWEAHSKNVAKVAEKIAKASGLDSDKAYAYGLLHDIGKSVSTPDENMTHHLTGHDLLMDLNFPEAARIAITHTFYDGQDMDHFWDILSRNKLAARTQELLEKYHPYDDYDKLIQLADNMATSTGITTIDHRFCDVLQRHLLPDPGGNLRALYTLKAYFDEKSSQNIYNLFHDEISSTIFT